MEVCCSICKKKLGIIAIPNTKTFSTLICEVCTKKKPKMKSPFQKGMLFKITQEIRK